MTGLGRGLPVSDIIPARKGVLQRSMADERVAVPARRVNSSRRIIVRRRGKRARALIPVEIEPRGGGGRIRGMRVTLTSATRRLRDRTIPPVATYLSGEPPPPLLAGMQRRAAGINLSPSVVFDLPK